MKPILFATASTLAIISAVTVYADENDAALFQNGLNNSALMVQGGDNNASALKQIGDDNAADIDQTGDINIAARVTGTDGLGQAMRQEGSANDLDIDQIGNRNAVGTMGVGLDQLGDRGVIAISQGTTNNTVGQVLQRGAVGAAATQNSLTVDQSGGDLNFIRNTSQTNADASGDANTMAISQSGRANLLGQRPEPAGGGLTQNGSGNAMTINQTGNENGSIAGNRTTAEFGRTAGLAGAEQASATQTGNGNTLTYDAVGDLNLFGSVQQGDGNQTDIDQNGSGNEAAAVQTGSNNTTTIQQVPGFLTGAGGDNNDASSSLIGSSNSSEITQQNNDNVAIDAVVGSLNALSTTQLGDGNTSNNALAGNDNEVTVGQLGLFGSNSSEVTIDGSNGLGDGNDVAVNQSGANDSTIEIFGDRSEIEVTQTGSNTSGISITGQPEGDDNAVSILQLNAGFGNNNSTVDITGDDNTIDVSQIGSNTATITLSGGNDTVSNGEGSDNQITVDQGNGSSVGTIGIIGDSNILTLDQSSGAFFGSAQHTATITIDGAFNEGDENTVAITQVGSGNRNRAEATVSISGDRNTIDLSQTGRNTAQLTISGASGGEGDDNSLNVVQTTGRFGSANSIVASIYGDNNNTGLSFTGSEAITVASAAGLTPGDMFQSGSGNDIQLSVGESFLESSGNAFAFSQQGSNNQIIGTISGGNSNQVAVAQVGSANLTNFNQIGSFNVLGVQQ